jgi:hypothetical protein
MKIAGGRERATADAADEDRRQSGNHEGHEDSKITKKSAGILHARAVAFRLPKGS